MGYRASVDSTQAEIALVWRQYGFWVHDLHLAARGYSFEHGGERVHGGIPDLLCQLGNVAVWVECKRADGRLKDSEAAFLAEAQWRRIPALVEYGQEDALRDAPYWRDVAMRRCSQGRANVVVKG